jgi:hypothetical protein
MRKVTAQPASYASLPELQRALLVQVRRYRRMNFETAASRTIVLNPTQVKAKPKRKDGGPEALDALYAQVSLLKNMSAQILTSFPSDPKAGKIRAAVDAFAQSVHERAEELRRSLADDARGKVDPSLVRLNRSLIRLLRDDLKGSFEDIQESFMVSQIKAPKVPEPVEADVAFVKISGLRGSDGYRHQTFYIIIAHPKASASKLPPFLVSASPEFVVPVKLRWDSSARSGNELHKIVKDLLVQDGIIGKAFTRNVPVPESRLKFAHDNVKRTSVKGDVVTVWVKDPKQIDETRAALRGQLASIVKQVDPKNRDVIRDKVERDTGVIKFVFSLPGRLRGRIVSEDVLRKIRQLLPVSNEELQRIKTALENPA